MNAGSAAATVELGTVHVLHVDDEPGFAELAGEFLTRANEAIQVTTATSAEEGLDHVRTESEPVDCIISDYDMPGQNGIEFLESVRDDHPDVPFILFTGKGSEAVASDAFSAGATDYLQKESGTDQYTVLANKVTNYVEKYATEQQLRRRARAMETVSEGIAIVDDGGTYVEVNESYASLYGVARSELVGEHWSVTVPDEEVAHIRDEVFPAANATGSWSGETRGKRVDGTTYPKLLSIATLDEGHVCVIRDITDRKDRERVAEELHETTRAFMAAETPEAVAEIAVETVGNILSLPHNGVHLARGDQEALEPIAWTDEGEDLVGVPPTFTEGESIAWEVYDTGEPHIYDDVSTASGRSNPDTDVRSEIVLPLGDHGVLIIGSPEADVFDETDVSLAQTLAANATTALDRIEREQALREERAFVEQALDTLDDVFYVIGPNGKLRRWNDQLPAVTGYTDQEVGEMDATEFFPEDEREAIAGAFEEGMTEGETRLEAAIRTADGDRIPYEFTGSRVTDTADELVGLVGVGRNVSERKRRERELEALHERTEFALAATDSAVWSVDLDTDEISFYGSGESPLGVHAETPKSMDSIFERIHPDDQSSVSQAYSRIRHGDSDELFVQFRTHPDDGEVRWVEANAFRQTNGEVEELTGLSTDVTEKCRRQSELERQNERLEEFASVASHDLRSPLNVAQGWLDRVGEDCESEHIERVERAHERMSALLEDLLTLAREGEARECESVELGQVVEASWQHVETTDATLSVQTERTVRADQSQFQQLLENLVRNAVEHGGDVTVTVGDLEDSSGFYVEDDGPGIPEGDRELVFEVGYTTREDSTGFGLGIVRRIAEAHGWEATVVEREGGGARFEFTGVEYVGE